MARASLVSFLLLALFVACSQARFCIVRVGSGSPSNTDTEAKVAGSVLRSFFRPNRMTLVEDGGNSDNLGDWISQCVLHFAGNEPVVIINFHNSGTGREWMFRALVRMWRQHVATTYVIPATVPILLSSCFMGSNNMDRARSDWKNVVNRIIPAANTDRADFSTWYGAHVLRPAGQAGTDWSHVLIQKNDATGAFTAGMFWHGGMVDHYDHFDADAATAHYTGSEALWNVTKEMWGDASGTNKRWVTFAAVFDVTAAPFNYANAIPTLQRDNVPRNQLLDDYVNTNTAFVETDATTTPVVPAPAPAPASSSSAGHGVLGAIGTHVHRFLSAVHRRFSGQQRDLQAV